jgi:hypothetical protein
LIIHLTQKLAKKIKVVPATAFPFHKNPLLDWTANMFMVSRWQCIIITNSHCLYSVLLAGRGLSSESAFIDEGMTALREQMTLDGALQIYDSQIAPHIDSISFCKTNDRRVLGSMNELVFLAKCDLLEIGLPIELVNIRLNETPMSMVRHHNPKLSLLALAKPKIQ